MQRNDQHLDVDDPLERYLAFEGLIQWTHAVIAQSERLSSAKGELGKQRGPNRIVDHRLAVADYHTQCHYFAIAAYKLLEFRDWAKSLKRRCQSNGGSSTCSAIAISRAAIYSARARHSTKAAERLCL